MINFLRTLAILIGVLFFSNSYGQDIYVPGYLVTTKGDTIKGFLNQVQLDKNSSKLFFKESKTDVKETQYLPSQLISFGIENERYISAIVKSEVSSRQTNELTTNPDLNLKTDSVFLHVIILGSKGLFHYKNEEGNDNFYISQNNGFELLIFKKYIKALPYKNVLASNNKFIGQLAFYLNDCDGIQSKLTSLAYTRKSFEKAFVGYYKCIQSEPEFYKKKEKMPVDVGFMVGLTNTTLSFKGGDKAFFTQSEFSTSNNISLGFYFDAQLAKNRGRWFINNELFYSSYKVSGSYEDYQNQNNFVNTTTNFAFSYLKLNTMFRYKIPTGKISIFFNLGMSNGIAIKKKNDKRIEANYYSTINVTEETAFDDARTYEQGLILGLGSKIKRTSFELRFENGNGMSSIPTVKSKANRLHFLVGYRF